MANRVVTVSLEQAARDLFEETVRHMPEFRTRLVNGQVKLEDCTNDKERAALQNWHAYLERTDGVFKEDSGRIHMRA